MWTSIAPVGAMSASSKLQSLCHGRGIDEMSQPERAIPQVAGAYQTLNWRAKRREFPAGNGLLHTWPIKAAAAAGILGTRPRGRRVRKCSRIARSI
jgi:hypothetical protein